VLTIFAFITSVLQAKTLMFITVSPSELQLRESLASLAFGTRCKTVTLGPVAANSGHSGAMPLLLPLSRPAHHGAATQEAFGIDAAGGSNVLGHSVDDDDEP
jgi:hypothetical protein